MKELSGNKIVKIMRLRLNMIKVRMNYKRIWEGNLKCPLCIKEEDTTEHILICKLNNINTQRKLEDCQNMDVNGWNDIIEIAERNINIRNTLLEESTFEE